MRGIKSVEFVFENVTSLTIDAKYFDDIEIGEFERHVCRVASNSVSSYTVAKKMLFSIFAEADGDFFCYGQNEGKKFERILAWDDITSIEITYDDGEVETIYTDYDEWLYEGQLGANNVNQTSMLSELGNLYICIWAGHRVKEVFPHHAICDVEENEFKKEMFFRIEDKIASMSDEEKKTHMEELEKKLGEEFAKTDEAVTKDG